MERQPQSYLPHDLVTDKNNFTDLITTLQNAIEAPQRIGVTEAITKIVMEKVVKPSFLSAITTAGVTAAICGLAGTIAIYGFDISSALAGAVGIGITAVATTISATLTAQATYQASHNERYRAKQLSTHKTTTETMTNHRYQTLLNNAREFVNSENNNILDPLKSNILHAHQVLSNVEHTDFAALPAADLQRFHGYFQELHHIISSGRNLPVPLEHVMLPDVPHNVIEQHPTPTERTLAATRRIR